MKISKRVREEAALICAVRASGWGAGGSYLLSMGDNRDAIGASEEAAALARLSYFHVDVCEYGFERYAIEWAEAESLLRTGWCPPHE